MAESGMESNEGRSKFNLNWSPEAPAGIEFKHVVPDDFGSGYQAFPAESEQTELKTKMRSSRLRSRRHSKVINFTKKPKSFNFLKKAATTKARFQRRIVNLLPYVRRNRTCQGKLVTKTCPCA